MKYTIYIQSSGQIFKSVTTTSTDPIELDTGYSYIDGDYSSQQYYIKNNQVVEFPPKPTDNKYRFNYTTQQWELITPVVTEQSIRSARDLLLTDIDRVNPVWYDSLTTQQQAELIEYRQALLDVPQQTGFPQAVVWPTKPTWL
jgi:hypothetical protein